MNRALAGLGSLLLALLLAPAAVSAADKVWLGPPQPGESQVDEAASHEKSVANGLILEGPFSYNHPSGSSTINISVGHITNNSSFRTTGTLRLYLWATLTRPARGGSISGYILARSSNFSPLSPNFQYNNVSINPSYSAPPNGTYYMTIVLAEYDPANCSQLDGYCVSDSFTFTNTQSFGTTTPPPPPTLTSGVTAKTLGSRGTVTPSATLYGGFELMAQSTVLFLVRGNSLGTLGVTQNYLDAPRVRIYNQSGVDLVSQGGYSGFNSCSEANVLTDYPVMYYYQQRGSPVHPRDSCYTAYTLAAGVYTFSITPSILGVTSSGLSSSPQAGEVLFEVSLFR